MVLRLDLALGCVAARRPLAHALVTLFAYFLFWNERLFALPWHSELWLRGIITLPVLFSTFVFLLRPGNGGPEKLPA